LNQAQWYHPASLSSTSTRMHDEFLRLLFLQAHRETEAHLPAAGMSSQRNQSVRSLAEPREYVPYEAVLQGLALMV